MLRVILLVIVGCYATLPTIAIDDIANVLPLETRIFVEFADIGDARKERDATSFGQLWNSRAMAAFRHEYSRSKSQLSDRITKMFGLSDEGVKVFAHDRLVVVAIESTPKEIGFSIFAEMDPNLGRAIADQGISTLIAAGAVAVDEELALPARVYRRQDGNHVVYMYHDGYLFVSADLLSAKSIAKRWSEKYFDNSLGRQAAFASLMNATDKEETPSDARCYVDVIGLATAIEQPNNAQTADAARVPFPQRHGLPGIQGIGGRLWVLHNDFDYFGHVVVHAPPPLEGVLRSFTFSPGVTLPPKLVPAETSNTMFARWDVLQMLTHVGDLYDDVADAPGAWQATLSDWKQFLKFDLLGDVLPLLDTEMVITSTYDPQLHREQSLMSIPLKDHKREAQLAKAIYCFWRKDNNASRLRVPGYRYDLWKIRFKNEDGNTAFSGAGMMVADGRLWIATHAHYIQSTLLRRGVDPLIDTADFAEASARLEKWIGDHSIGRSYVRTDRDARLTYESLRTGGIEGLENAESICGSILLTLLGGKDSETKVDINFTTLPEFATVRKYFGTIAAVANQEDYGWSLAIGNYNLKH